MVPEALIARLAETDPARADETGAAIAAATIGGLQQIEGVAGVHLMPVSWPDGLAKTVAAAGMLPRPPMPY
jgi:methylenetetrahydrofolate reductase (NADPH)